MMTHRKPVPQGDELLWLVDSEDREVGSVLKSVAHGDPTKLHREVGVFVFGEKGLLMQRRSESKARHPGEWQATAAGHVPYGDTYEEAAHMELREEVGFDVRLKPYRKILLEDPAERRFMQLYFGKYDGSPIIIQTEELEEARFFSEEEYGALKRSSAPITSKSIELIDEFFRLGPDGLIS